VLAVLLWWSSRDGPRESGGLAIEGGADGVGAAVYVNGRVIGEMQAELGDSALGSRLDARVQLRRLNEIVVVSARGMRLVSLAPLGESTLVWVSFAARRLTVTPAGAGATQTDADTLAEYDD
jgi:hypothetical protein